MELTGFEAPRLGSAKNVTWECGAGLGICWFLVTIEVWTGWPLSLIYRSWPKGCPYGSLCEVTLTMASCDLMLRLATEHANNNSKIDEVIFISYLFLLIRGFSCQICWLGIWEIFKSVLLYSNIILK